MLINLLNYINLFECLLNNWITIHFYGLLKYNNFIWKNLFLLGDNLMNIYLTVFFIILSFFFFFHFFNKFIFVFFFFISIYSFFFFEIYFNNEILEINNNFILINGILIIHPILVFFSYVFNFFFKTTNYSNNYNNSYDFIFLRRISFFFLYISFFSIYLGSLWAQQELNWGGFWSWDPVELTSLIFFFFILSFVHLPNYKYYNFFFENFKTNIYIYFYVFILIVRLDFLESNHNFVSFDFLSRHTITFTIFSILLFINFFFIKKSNIFVNVFFTKTIITDLLKQKKIIFFDLKYFMIIVVIGMLVVIYVNLQFYNGGLIDDYTNFKQVFYILFFFNLNFFLKKNNFNFFCFFNIEYMFVMLFDFKYFNLFIFLIHFFWNLIILKILIYQINFYNFYYSLIKNNEFSNHVFIINNGNLLKNDFNYIFNNFFIVFNKNCWLHSEKEIFVKEFAEHFLLKESIDCVFWFIIDYSLLIYDLGFEFLNIFQTSVWELSLISIFIIKLMMVFIIYKFKIKVI